MFLGTTDSVGRLGCTKPGSVLRPRHNGSGMTQSKENTLAKNMEHDMDKTNTGTRFGYLFVPI